MSYLNVFEESLLSDIQQRKEFYSLKTINEAKKQQIVNIDNPKTFPLYSLDYELGKNNQLRLFSYQQFVRNFASIHTPYDRLLMKHSTGSGKTLGAIGLAMEYINAFRKEDLVGVSKSSIGSVFILGFNTKVFEKELLRFPQFGFATRAELEEWSKLKDMARRGTQQDIDKANDYGNKIRRRLYSRTGNGFFRMFGWGMLVNRLFISKDSITSMSEETILGKIKKGSIKINTELLRSFRNSLIICDEIHDVYNTIKKNNWGIALQTVLDSHPSIKAVLMSATPINNSPSEIIDLLNLLLPKKMRIKRNDYFSNNNLRPGALKKLRELSIGRVSYLMDLNPKYYPSRQFIGECIKGISYLKFVRCTMGHDQLKVYQNNYNKKDGTFHKEGIYALDIIYPSPEPGKFVYKTSDMKRIALAPTEWKKKNNIDFVDGVVVGELFGVDRLRKISCKYWQMVKDIISMIKRRRGKILIYNNYIVVSGVLVLAEILKRNGIIGQTEHTSPNTLCSICGEVRSKHKSAPAEGFVELDDKKDGQKSKKKSNDTHAFSAARFTLIHSNQDKLTNNRNMEKFNRPSNSRGEELMILLGSRMIKQSYDFSAIRNVLITNRPDNIPMMIQILGRAVRQGSHKLLSPDERNVDVRIYVSSFPSPIDKMLTYEEAKYKEKIGYYKTIQQIEKIFHENAVDAPINHDIIKKGLQKDSLGDLDFNPTLKQRTYTLNSLNLSTFNAYYSNKEIELIIYIIKRSFLEVSRVWTFTDLFKFIKGPSFHVEYDTSLIQQDNFVIALSYLLWDEKSNVFEEKKKYRLSTPSSVLDKLFDSVDKRIILPGGDYYIISQVGCYYCLFPLDKSYVKKDIDSPYRGSVRREHSSIDVRDYLKRSALKFNYIKKKKSFHDKYKNIPIDKLFDAVCDYGMDFQIRFVEDCITYIFNTWTDWSTDKSDYHDFYFKMLFYYDLIGLIIWANTSKEYIYQIYKEYINPLDVKKLKLKREYELKQLKAEKGKISAERDQQNLLNLLARNITKVSCEWCPKVLKEIYTSSLDRSLVRFNKVKKPSVSNKVLKIDSDILPIGHFFEKIPKFYHPDKGWFSSPKYLHSTKNWIENPLIIGYHEKSKTGVHVRFKLRKPIKQIIKHKDSRFVETGTICSTKPKTWLLDMCKKLKIKTEDKLSTNKLCQEIQSKIMYLELLERAKGTNIKWFYSHYEMGPIS